MRNPEIIEITPDLAAEMLKGNIGNRPISKSTVTRYANEMKAGRWKESGQSISIWWNENNECILLNGQHRLLALIEAGLTMKFLVVEEDDPSVFSVMDVGKVRQVNTILSMAGYNNVTVRRAMARIAIYYERFADSEEPWSGIITGQEVLQWTQANAGPRMDMVINCYIQSRERLKPTNSWYGGFAWLVYSHSNHSGEWLRFHEGFSTGLGLKSGDPIYALRQYTINRQISTKGGKFAQSAWDRQVSVAIAIKAWNDWLAGKEARYYKFQKNSLPMPKVH